MDAGEPPPQNLTFWTGPFGEAGPNRPRSRRIRRNPAEGGVRDFRELGGFGAKQPTPRQVLPTPNRPRKDVAHRAAGPTSGRNGNLLEIYLALEGICLKLRVRVS